MGKRFAVVVCIICLAVFGQENIIKNADWKEIGTNGVPVGWSIRPEVIAEHGGDGGADFTLSVCKDTIVICRNVWTESLS